MVAWRGAAFHAVILAHGSTDVDVGLPRLLVAYVPAFVIPCHARAVMCAFLAASVQHFADDFGSAGISALAHCFLAHHVYWQGERRALHVVNQYLACVHVPLHFHRVWSQERYSALAVAGIATLSATVYLYCNPGAWMYTTLGNWKNESFMRLAIAHVLCGCLSRNTSPKKRVGECLPKARLPKKNDARPSCADTPTGPPTGPPAGPPADPPSLGRFLQKPDVE
jgi:hypothetical protein